MRKRKVEFMLCLPGSVSHALPEKGGYVESENGAVNRVVSFVVKGLPRGKQRPIFTRKSGRARTPDKTVAYEEEVRWSFLIAKKDQCPWAGEERIVRDRAAASVSIQLYYPVAKSTPRWRRELIKKELLLPTRKPDIDNVAKIILDGLNGLAYKDDAQVSFLLAHKNYCSPGDEKVEVCVFEIPGSFVKSRK